MVMKKSTVSFIPFLCISFTVVFSVANACGRSTFGLEQAQTSRYRIAYIPLVIGLYFLLYHIRISIVKYVCLGVLLISLGVREVQLDNRMIGTQITLGKVKKEAFRTCAQQGISISACETQADFVLSCGNKAIMSEPEVVQFLEFLRRRHANLYAP